MSINQEIRNFIVDNFLFGEEGGLTDDTSFLKQGIIDSTGVMQLVAFLQDRYLLTIDDEELTPDNLDSISRVVSFIETKRARPGAGASVSGEAGTSPA